MARPLTRRTLTSEISPTGKHVVVKFGSGNDSTRDAHRLRRRPSHPGAVAPPQGRPIALLRLLQTPAEWLDPSPRVRRRGPRSVRQQGGRDRWRALLPWSHYRPWGRSVAAG